MPGFELGDRPTPTTDKKIVMPVVDSDMVMESSHEGRTPSSTGDEGALPVSLCGPAAEILKNFYHTKRVGNYLIGRKLGEGSFAKVREGLHALTGEKVSRNRNLLRSSVIYS